MRLWFLLILLVPALAFAAEPDLSSPKTAAKSLFNAISSADREAVAASLYAADDSQRELTAAMADFIVAGKKLGDAAREKFGTTASDPIGRGMLDPSDLTKLEQAKVNESGESATVTVPEQSRPMSFRRQDGKWKLVVTDFAAAAPGNVARQTKLVRSMADAVETSAEEIAAGKYKTAEAATAAIQQSLHQVMLNFYRPPATTRAVTQPAASRPAATQPPRPPD